MKLVAFLSILLVGWTLAILPDQLGYDTTTTSPWYQTCKAGTNAILGVPAAALFSGTACIAFNPQSKTYHYYIAHSLPTYAGFNIYVYFCNNIGDCNLAAPISAATTAATLATAAARPNVQSGPFAPLTGSFQFTTVGRNAVPASLILYSVSQFSTSAALSETFTFDNVINYNKAPGQPGTQELMGISSNKDGSGYKYAPTYVESFTPMAGYVLLSRLPNSKNLNVRSSSLNMVVAAVGAGVGTVSEGDLVRVMGGFCLSRLVKLNANPANTDDVLALSPYCCVPALTILGKVSESNYGANRANAGVSHIKQAQSSSWMMSASNSFTKLTV